MLDTFLAWLENNTEIVANIMLFLSPSLILIDKAPSDFIPSQKNIIKAIELLREKKNIFGPIPVGITIKPEGSVAVFRDEKSFNILLEFILKNAPRAKNVNSNQIVSIGYSIISAPVDNNTIEALFPLYFAIIPETENDFRLKLIPVGKLEDLDNWISKIHIRSLTKTALYMLVIGFFLQLLSLYLR